jgi:hypothetical protein
MANVEQAHLVAIMHDAVIATDADAVLMHDSPFQTPYRIEAL